MFPAQRPITAVAALATLVFVAAAGCSSAQRQASAVLSRATTEPAPTSTTAEATTTSTIAAAESSVVTAGEVQPLTGTDGGSSATTTTTPPADSSDEFDSEFTAIDAALDDGDLCGVYQGLAGLSIGNSSAAGMAQMLERIGDVMVKAEPLVAPRVRDDWHTLGVDTIEAGRMLRAHPHDVDAAGRRFDAPEYRAAQSAVESAMETTCG
ncbi:MAG: hypothetical protein U0Q22_16930 [Acidimicrobiales bacterium]